MKDVSDEQVRGLATEILSRPEYAQFRYRDPELPGWISWLIEQIRGFVTFSQTLYLENPLAYWALVVGLTVVAIALFAHIVYSVRRALTMVPAEAESESIAGYVDLARRADEAAYQGGFLDAARCLQLACIELLVKRGWLELSRSDPNSVLRRRLAQSGLSQDVETSMHALIDRLELGQFRDHAAGQSLYLDWRQLYGRLTDLEQRPS